MMPERIGPYRLERMLGRGGMGVVYAAWDERLRRRVALKRLLPEVAGDSRRRERVRREARSIARLDHAAIVQIYDLLETGEGDWIVMQYIEAPTVAERLRRGPLPTAEVVTLARDVAGALAAAHEQGLLHRDLKAENVLLTPGGGAKVLDFSLGTLLYEAATGISPFQDATPVATMTRVCTHQQPPAHEVEPAVPMALAELIDSLLEKDPARRPASAASFLHRLDAAVAEGSLPPATAAQPTLHPLTEPNASVEPTLVAPSTTSAGRRFRLSSLAGVLALGALLPPRC